MVKQLDAAFYSDPHSRYRTWRAEGPVHRIDFGDGLTRWLILGYDEARSALTDSRLRKDIVELETLIERKRGVPHPTTRPEAAFRHMLNADPPEHARLRKAVAKVFTGPKVAALRPVVERLTGELLDAMAEQDRVDLLAAFAIPLPVAVICHLLDVDIADRDAFREWTKAIVGTPDPHVNPAQARGDMVAFLQKLLQDKRSAPGADLLSVLATDADARLHDGELLGTALLLLVAGHETTVNLIGNGMLALLRDRAWLERLRADPDLVPAAVEEFLRYDGPVNLTTPRFTAEPITVGGTVIPADEIVYVAVAAGNRDPRHYLEPDRMDPSAGHAAHLGFGHGAHFCVGAPLARLEGTIAFTALLRRFPEISLAVDESDLRWYPNAVIHGLESLPVHLRPGGR